MSGDFLVIPAVDIRAGRCVRLVQGLAEDETVFAEDPAEVARLWEAGGAPMLHVVDLDGAFEGRPVNYAVITRLIDRVSIPVEIGGGIRTRDDASRYLEAGAARVVTGTRALTDQAWLEELAAALGERLVVGLDVKGGMAAIAGWTDSGTLKPVDAVGMMERAGVKRIIYTDVSRDGTLHRPNFEGVEAIASAASIPVIASGGVSDLADIRRLSGMGDAGVEGVIVGMALYRKRFTLAEALGAAEKGE